MTHFIKLETLRTRKISVVFVLIFQHLLFSSISFGQCVVDLDEGLFASFPFNGNANDATGNGYDGTVFNGVSLTTDRFGVTNSAYEFDGVDDYISTSSTFDFPQRTLSLWRQPYSIIGAGG